MANAYVKSYAEEMRGFKTRLAQALESEMAGAPEEFPMGSWNGMECSERWTFNSQNEAKFGRFRFEDHGGVASNVCSPFIFQLTLFKSRPLFEEILQRVKRLPISVSPHSTPRVRMPDPDEIDAALDIYGDAATAATKLQAQLDRADELEIEQKQRSRLDGLIENLRERAKVTSDPAKQRTKIVAGLIKAAQEREAEEQAAQRTVAASVAAEAHADMPALKQFIAEHKARNLKLGIANETDTYRCNYAGLPHETPSPLHFDVGYSTAYTDRRLKNTKNNGKIKALQQSIATSLGCWLRREKRVDLTRYWKSDYSSATEAA